MGVVAATTLVASACGSTADRGAVASASGAAGTASGGGGTGGSAYSAGAGSGGTAELTAGSTGLAGAGAGGVGNGGAPSAGSGGALSGGTGGALSAGSGGAASAGSGGAAPQGARLQLGILPDYDNAKSNTNGIAGFVSRTGIVPFLASNYMNVSGGSFNTAQAKSFIDEALAAGVKCAAISLATGDSDVPATAQSQIAAAVAYGAQHGITVQIRFGYEMNGNWSPSYHGGDATIFKHTWAQVAAAVRPAGGQMVWAPNIVGGGISAYDAVLPEDPKTIDVIGLDFYHFNSSETNLVVGSDEVDKAFATIYPLVTKLNKPFLLTETAVSYFVTSGAWPDATANEVAEKLLWLKQLSSPALLAKYPLYRGFVWFDYNKHESDQYRDFSISQQATETAMFGGWVTQNQGVLVLGG